MSRCELTAKGRVVKNLVSHSNIKTKSRAYPNIHAQSFFSQALGEKVRLKVAASTLRSVEHRGGLDPFILKQDDKLLSSRALEVKKSIRKKLKGF